MVWKLLIALGVAVVAGSGALASGAWFAGPGRGVTGNDTGGIIPYSPEIEASYEDIAATHCARWYRMAKVTSVHRKYGDYIAFVCYDRPGHVR